ncbi:GerMN domain-containing protein [Streptomyces sp. P6-2-1]|uniref:GerMN domain-containing protein n=1 Tax=Streptomyces sp. P6-2-1 TaxID=3422591 RepID=UPI003D36B156
MRRRPFRYALAAAGLALLAACGVPPTGVIEVGTPATGLSLTQGVYFLVRDAPGTLRAAPRAEGSTAGALRALLKGPSRAERTSLTTALPARLPLPGLTTTRGTLDLRFPRDTPHLSSRAVRQLACTALLNTAGLSPAVPHRAASPTDAPADAPAAAPTDAAAGQGAALPSPRVTRVRVTVPGATPAVTAREECPGLTG